MFLRNGEMACARAPVRAAQAGAHNPEVVGPNPAIAAENKTLSSLFNASDCEEESGELS